MGFGFWVGLVGGINKFSGLINGEAVYGKGRGGEREGNEIMLLGTWMLVVWWCGPHYLVFGSMNGIKDYPPCFVNCDQLEGMKEGR